jgi:hypothetical protein
MFDLKNVKVLLRGFSHENIEVLPKGKSLIIRYRSFAKRQRFSYEDIKI